MKRIIAFALILMLALGIAACGKTEVKDADLGVVLTDIETAVPLDDMMSLSESDLLSYYGIDAADVSQFKGSINASGIKADEIVMIEAADTNAAKRVQDKLDEYLVQKGKQFESYIPAEYAVIQQCDTKAYGKYVVLFVSLEADEMTKVFESHVL
ncbi:MAG: DUF4358 domain-containing protein [Christensenellales bacterium]|jgi:hypothetical protein